MIMIRDSLGFVVVKLFGFLCYLGVDALQTLPPKEGQDTGRSLQEVRANICSQGSV